MSFLAPGHMSRIEHGSVRLEGRYVRRVHYFGLAEGAPETQQTVWTRTYVRNHLPVRIIVLTTYVRGKSASAKCLRTYVHGVVLITALHTYIHNFQTSEVV